MLSIDISSCHSYIDVMLLTKKVPSFLPFFICLFVIIVLILLLLVLLLLLLLLLFVGNCLSIIVNGQQNENATFCTTQTVILGCNISKVKAFVWSFSGIR